MLKFVVSMIMLSHCLAAMATQSNEISALHWQYRIVLINSVNPKPLVAHISESTQMWPEDIRARKLLFVVINKKQIACFPSVCANIRLANWKQSYEIQQNSVLLIGLDGSVKHRYRASTFDLEDIFADIDMMPMRRREIENEK